MENGALVRYNKECFYIGSGSSLGFLVLGLNEESTIKLATVKDLYDGKYYVTLSSSIAKLSLIEKVIYG